MKLGEGQPSSQIMLVGDCFNEHEERTGSPLSSYGGQELNKLLHEAGIMRSECYATNLCNSRPPHNDLEKWIAVKKKDAQPDWLPLRGIYVHPNVMRGYLRLLREIEMVRPNVIIPVGNFPMWALTGAMGIKKWRGSQLNVMPLPGDTAPLGAKVIPTLPPGWIMADPSNWALVVLDLKRAARERNTPEYTNVPHWSFTVRPSFDTVLGTLAKLSRRVTDEDAGGEGEWVDFDLETRAGHIACAGLSWTKRHAISIPFMCVEDRSGYWGAEEEAEIVYQLYKLLTHPKVKVRGQNLLYDCQYTYRHWHFVPSVAQDTMIAHHSVFCGLPKGLDFLASMYNDHYVNWKPEKSTWKVGG